jgi:Fe-S oxidoreductase
VLEVVLLHVEKREVTIGNPNIMIATVVYHDPCTAAKDEGVSPWVVITTTRGVEEGVGVVPDPIVVLGSSRDALL